VQDRVFLRAAMVMAINHLDSKRLACSCEYGNERAREEQGMCWLLSERF
jgi:hypothetical protein